jgi:hypothetical protein
MDRQFDRAEDQLNEDYANGVYTQAEYNERMRDLGREYQEAVVEEAEAAYDDVMYQRGGYR